VTRAATAILVFFVAMCLARTISSHRSRQVHTNGLANFRSVLKRARKGTYVSVDPFHLFRYLDEQAYSFSNRKMTDAARFVSALRAVLGKRLTYTTLTGSELPQTC
jgi:hypothetical protein